ncbi:hypothetical protein QO002_000902 [Pararhizobium capsulatum DSM 1112]|uniref:Uncharacterized protein n=1 Tax=Pararhizobium capsulatum DSM 1112 TaxID=1121113 RepID=A0ABU0BKI6_9HYPH|nr:hypothetical protein [Pararhizobium capsulatum DSM 1112]
MASSGFQAGPKTFQVERVSLRGFLEPDAWPFAVLCHENHACPFKRPLDGLQNIRCSRIPLIFEVIDRVSMHVSGSCKVF